MTRAALLAIALTYTPLVLLAQTAGEAEVRAAEEAWRLAYEVCDVPAMSRLLSDDLTLIQHVNGSTLGKDPFVKSVAACSMEKVVNVPDRVRLYRDTAVVQGRSTYSIKKMASTISVIYTRVWVKQDGRWQVANHQSTGLPAAH